MIFAGAKMKWLLKSCIISSALLWCILNEEDLGVERIKSKNYSKEIVNYFRQSNIQDVETRQSIMEIVETEIRLLKAWYDELRFKNVVSNKPDEI